MAYYSDIDINLEKQASGDIKRDINIDAVKNSIENILRTIPGSRRMLPEFATNVNSLLFDTMDEITAYNIGELCLQAIQRWDDRIIVEEVSIIPKYDQNRYECSLIFRIARASEPEELNFILDKL